jgi:DNA-binding NarL/FixJ family response regulator
VIAIDHHAVSAEGIRIYIVEDQVLFRETLAEFLDSCPGMSVVGRAGEGEEGLREILRLRPDLVLVDIGLPTIDGLDVCRRIKATQPGTRVVVVTAYTGADIFRRAVQVGVDGFMLKDVSLEHLVDTIRVAHLGSPTSNGRVLSHLGHRGAHPRDNLTRREKQVLRAIALGRDNRAIATELNIREKTVRNHVANIYDKLSLQGRAQAVLYALQNGMA